MLFLLSFAMSCTIFGNRSTLTFFQMRSMLLYLEAARYKVGGTLAEVEGSKRDKHPLAEHILVSRDKQGLQQSVLKVSFRNSYRYLE